MLDHTPTCISVLGHPEVKKAMYHYIMVHAINTYPQLLLGETLKYQKSVFEGPFLHGA